MNDPVPRHLRRFAFPKRIDINHGHPRTRTLFRDIPVTPAHTPYLPIITPVYGPTAPADENWDHMNRNM